MPDQALYILGPESPGDPLDCVAAAAPFLAARYDAIRTVGPGQAMSLRSMRRIYAPGVDRLLYDFTAPADHSWAMEALLHWPGAVLLAGRAPVALSAAATGLRSAQRYAAEGFRFPPSATIGALDGAPLPLRASSLVRPAATISALPQTDDLALAVGPGAIETAYAALLGLAGESASVAIIAAARRDANDLIDIIDALQITSARVRYVRSRKDAVAAATCAGGLIDALMPDHGLSDAGFAAHCVGAPVLSLTSRDTATRQAADFAAAKPARDPAAAQEFAAARPASAFADSLVTLIEAGFHQARTGNAA